MRTPENRAALVIAPVINYTVRCWASVAGVCARFFDWALSDGRLAMIGWEWGRGPTENGMSNMRAVRGTVYGALVAMLLTALFYSTFYNRFLGLRSGDG